LDSAGELQGFVKILRDDTERKEAAETLEIVKEQLEQRVQERTTELELSNMMLVDQIMERRRAEEELRQRNQELATLNDFSTVVSGSLELADTFNSLYRLLAEQMRIPGGALFLYDPLSDDVQLQSSWGFPSHFLADFQSFPLAGCYFEPVIREQKVLLHQDFREVSLFLGLRLNESRPDWRSFLCVPLLAKGEAQGVFGLFCQAPNSFQAEQMGFFQTLGQQVGIAIYNARLFAEAKRSREGMQLLASKVVQAQEEERRRVSRELHDEAGQSLTGLLLHLEMMRAQLEEGPPIRAGDVTEAIQITSETMESIRRLAHGLRPPALDTVGLNRVLEAMCQDMARRAQITIHYEGVELATLPDPITVSFYRVLQEALTNITKHAQATQVDVTLQQENGHISLLVVDNGCGFTQGPNDDLGVGLTGMRERLQMLGGILRIRSQTGGGVELKALVPLAL
jgi:signal transduction histidine kinase